MRWDRLRACGSGPFYALPTALALVVAVQHFHASAAAKAWLASAMGIGYLLAPLAVLVAARLVLPVGRAFAIGQFAAAAALLGAALCAQEWAFLLGLGAAQVLVALGTTFITTWWQQNAAAGARGRLYSGSIRLEVAGHVLGSLLIAWWIGDAAGRYRPVLGVIAVGLAWAGWCAWRIPTVALAQPGGGARNPFAPLAWLWRDRAFGFINLSWTIMGFANFMILPLRAEYLANPAYGLAYRADTILLLLVGLPALVRILALPLWGRLFDRSGFVLMRCIINLTFVAATVVIFTPYPALQALGAIGFGLAFAGGDIAWSLWVTKYAPAERTSDYMAVHVFLTGVRALAGPAAGFALYAAGWSPLAVAWLSGGLTVMATLLLARENPRPTS